MQSCLNKNKEIILNTIYIGIISSTNFLYSLTICLLHYYNRHVWSINMPIFRRKNCIHTASGIFALCKRLHSTLVESGLRCTVEKTSNYKENCALKLINEIILYYDARSKKKHQTIYFVCQSSKIK